MTEPIIEKRIACIESHELALRICEAVCQIKRPKAKTAEAAMAELRKMPDGEEVVAGCYRAALAAGLYFEQCINKRQRIQ